MSPIETANGPQADDCSQHDSAMDFVCAQDMTLRRGPQDMTQRNNAMGGLSQQQLPAGGLADEAAAEYEPVDVTDTDCHWQDCGLMFDSQHQLVKVRISHTVDEILHFELWEIFFKQFCQKPIAYITLKAFWAFILHIIYTTVLSE